MSFMDLFDEIIPLPSVEQVIKLIEDTSHYSTEMITSLFGGWIGANAAVKNKGRRVAFDHPIGSFQCGPSICTRVAGLSGGIAVAMTAYGAHFITTNPDISDERKRAMEHANRQHFLNTIGMALAGHNAHYPTMTASLFALSTLLFCVPAYAYAVRNDRRLRVLSPYGGVLAILAWLSFVL
ncbi:hypothetical protein GPALN_004999 [Globodera pallida]|uniref:Transmembrane protein 256 homolog n=1 Tax=Globodera pallida TaxID=36090 RepID=A0A183C044_GLOPA|nr:hypothetical protein GPALN_004999 [Globodera pallida]